MQCLEVQIALFVWLLISVPQLCVYIFAILCAVSGILNWCFHLNLLYFHRNTTWLTKSGHTAFTTCHEAVTWFVFLLNMWQPEQPQTLLLVNMCTCASNSIPKGTNHSARHMSPSCSAKTSQVCHLWQWTIPSCCQHSCSKKLPYLDRHPFVLHSKISFNTLWIQIIYSTCCTIFTQTISLNIYSLLRLKILTTIFTLKIIKPYLILKNQRTIHLPLHFVSHKFLNLSIFIKTFITCLSL